eukprot:TRINITY_DN6353_c0_g1_i1.p1 TRINITY_DN6353_c0_g1~~TRINITY_DN6353_c0_g1_i1.p1  ORF type:complete len:337 (-),score=50.72 TRINITY_DN6353_c0_g1_i1:178-1188(-)
MRIVSWNVNGMRAMLKKLGEQNFPLLFEKHNVDVFCFQETKLSSLDQIPYAIQNIPGYESFWSCCKSKKGYSGVATYARKGLAVDAKVTFGVEEFDNEGRIVMLDFQHFLLYNVYFPNSGGGERIDYKMKFYQWFYEECMLKPKLNGRSIIVVGDVNTAHTDLDLHNPEYYAGNLYVKERETLNAWFSEPGGFVDALRHLNPEKRGLYSWFDPTNLGARTDNKGWRLDYTICDLEFSKSHLVNAGILYHEGEGLSDHCPVFIETKDFPTIEAPQTHPLSSLFTRKRQPSIHSFFTKTKSTEKSSEGESKKQSEDNSDSKKEDGGQSSSKKPKITDK